jgi:hypothetical protein
MRGVTGGNREDHYFLVILPKPVDRGADAERAGHSERVLIGAATQECSGSGLRSRCAESVGAPGLRPDAKLLGIIAGQQQFDFPGVRRNPAEVRRDDLKAASPELFDDMGKAIDRQIAGGIQVNPDYCGSHAINILHQTADDIAAAIR